jgi:hypothetical protein
MLAEQNEPSPYNHHLQQFLTFLKRDVDGNMSQPRPNRVDVYAST